MNPNLHKTAMNTSEPATANDGSPCRLNIQPRYHRWFVDSGIPWTESNTAYARLEWSLPVKQAALVVIDAWDKHYLSDSQERNEHLIASSLEPLITACRNGGMQIVHAPAERLAPAEPAWVGRTMAIDRPLPDPRDPDWPPADFVRKQGAWSCYARPKEARQDELTARWESYAIHPRLRPQDGDVVVLNGNELHQYCKHRGIVFLFFAGFHVNACLVQRDYGVLAMQYRGYDTILVRDATTAMETPQTREGLLQHSEAVRMFEMFGSYSVTVEEIIQGLHSAANEDTCGR